MMRRGSTSSDRRQQSPKMRQQRYDKKAYLARGYLCIRVVPIVQVLRAYIHNNGDFHFRPIRHSADVCRIQELCYII